MKTISTSLILTSAALVCGSALAQSSPAPVIPQSSPADARVFLDVEGVYARASTKETLTIGGSSDSGKGTLNMGGAEVSLGAYFADSSVGVHQVGATLGVAGGSSTEEDAGVTAKESITTVPLLAMYNYNFKIGKDTYFYLGARAGMVVVAQKIEIESAGYSSDTDAAIALGGTLGFKHFFTENFGMQVGYEYRKLSNLDYDHEISGTKFQTKLGSPDMHLLKIGFAFRF